jgi:glycosyltransferase involved in cell wall biosynthesis
LAANQSKRALMLAPETPYPLHGGGALRTASLLNYLSQHYEVDLIVFRHRPEQDPARALPPGLVRNVQVIDLPHHRKDALSRLTRNAWRLARGVPPLIDRFRGFAARFSLAAHYDLAVIEHFWCAEYLDTIARVSDRVVLNLHNIESVLHETCARADPALASFAHRHFAGRSRTLESHWLPRFDSVLAASEADASRIRALHGALHEGPAVIVYPNAIPMIPVPQRAEEDLIAFSGNLEYHPNRTAVQFFAREVWPALSRNNPTLKWRLIGMNPHAIRRDIEGLERVETTGPVADAIHELAAAKVVVAPLLSGSGTRLKIIEAWAAARPVVATHLGAEGLPVTNRKDIYLADDPRDLVQSIQTLLDSHVARRKMGIEGRCIFEHRFSWEAAWQTLDSGNFLME